MILNSFQHKGLYLQKQAMTPLVTASSSCNFIQIAFFVVDPIRNVLLLFAFEDVLFSVQPLNLIGR